MKILVYTSLFPNHLNPDFGIFIKNRMFNFAKLDNCEIVVVAPVPYCPPWKILGKWYEFSKIKKKEVMQGITIYHPRYLLIPKISMLIHGLSMFLSSIRTIKKIKKEFLFDLIDAHYVYPDGFAGMLLSRYSDKPFVVSARGTDINQFSNFRIIKAMICKTLKESQYIISVCNALKDVMLELGADSTRVKVIPNGIDTDLFYPQPKKDARKSLSLDDNKKIIFSAGGLIERKGHHIAIDAISEIVKIIPDVHFFIAGKGVYRRFLEEKISKKRLEDYITLLGHVPNTELKQWYSAADVFCLASSREGWANVIMESMACGTPVVATNVWGAPEIITDPDVGILVERNPEAISKALIDALKRDWNRKKILNHVNKRSWKVVAKEVHMVFSKVIEGWKFQ
jgi:glycosyltransferase involved in cell wall biosynthesis